MYDLLNSIGSFFDAHDLKTIGRRYGIMRRYLEVISLVLIINSTSLIPVHLDVRAWCFAQPAAPLLVMNE